MDRRDERDLLEVAVTVLGRALPWGDPVLEPPTCGRADERGGVLIVPTPSGPIRFTLEVKAQMAPRAAEQVVPDPDHQTNGTVVVAPWLSRGVRTILAERGLGFVDMTGNVLLRSDVPPLYISADGAQRNPRPTVARSSRGLSGDRAIEIVWAITVLRTPFRLTDVTNAVGGDLDPAYVSRVLRGLAADDLIRRETRGPVEEVDLVGVVERWVETYAFMTAHRTRGYLHLGGATTLLEQLRGLPQSTGPLQLTVTGPLAAFGVSPVTEPGLALIYTVDPPAAQRALQLVPAPAAEANIFLARPSNRIVTDRPWYPDDVPVAAPPIAAADSMSLGGRHVDAGLALLEWAMDNRGRWQVEPAEPCRGDA